mgnify:CR=1 FL=1
MLCNTCRLEEENKSSGLCTHCEDKDAGKINDYLLKKYKRAAQNFITLVMAYQVGK